MDFTIAQTFLDKFNYDLITIQVFPTLVNGKALWPRKGGQVIATGEPGSTAIAFSGALVKQRHLKSDLHILQRQRMGVYFMVNEGDGEFHGHKIVRNSHAVHTLKALFVDTDEGDPKKLKTFCRANKIKPHSIVESSPGKFHYYFFIEDTNATKENVFNWQSCQHRLASIDTNYDDSMADLGQVLRIPGFYHTKKKPFLIKEVYESKHPTYNLNEMFERLGAAHTPPRKGSKFNRPTKRVTKGARHEALTAYLGSLSNTLRDPESLLDAAVGFAQRHFQNPHEWLPGASREMELTDQVNYVLEERDKEELDQSIRLVEETQTQQGFKKLPDEFYLKAPGIVGKMVREICHYSAQPYPSFAFAAAASLVGTLKAPYVRGQYKDTPPSTYFLCLADSGRGKDFARAVVGRTFIKLGFKAFLTARFRSAQGFLKRLAKSNGIHLILHDEAHHLFAQIRKSDTDYITALKPHLLSMFSSANEPLYDAGAVVTQNIEIPAIPYPTINYCGFGVPTGFEDTFQSNELAEGLLTRFLVIRDHQTVLPLTNKNIQTPKKFKFEAYLREMSAKLRLVMETTLLDAEKKENASIDRKFVKIPMDDDAFKLWQEYSQKIADSRNSLGGDTLGVLQSRLVEQVGRLSVLLSDTVTTKEIVQFAITFVDHCYENIAMHAASFSKGQGNKDLDDLVSFVSDRIRITKEPMQAQDFCYFRIRDRHSLNNTLQLALDLQKIQKIDNYRKPGITKGRTSTAYIVTDSI